MCKHKTAPSRSLVADFVFCIFLEKLLLLLCLLLNEGTYNHPLICTYCQHIFSTRKWHGCPPTEDILVEPIH